MIRDLDLARRILQKMESRSYSDSGHCIEIEACTSEAVNYHVMLLNDAGLVTAEDVSNQNVLIWLPLQVTWAGHEFLDVSRSETRWKKAKRIIKQKGGSATFEILNELLTELMRDDVVRGRTRLRRRNKLVEGL